MMVKALVVVLGLSIIYGGGVVKGILLTKQSHWSDIGILFHLIGTAITIYAFYNL